MQYFYKNVPGLGHVAISRHAQSQMEKIGISSSEFEAALLKPTKPDTPDGQEIVWREKDNLRLVILLFPEPPTGAKLVKTVYRIKPQASSLVCR